MGFFTGTTRRKNTKGNRIRKLKGKVKKLEKKAAQEAELKRLENRYETLKRKS